MLDQRDHDPDGFPRSHVSASVARLRDQGVLATRVDSADGRRTLVTLADEVLERRKRRRPVPVDEALGAELNTSDPAELRPVIEAVEVLVERLIPRALADGQRGVRTRPVAEGAR